MISEGSRVSFKIRGTSARMEVPSSVFCTVRGVHPAPLCGYYRALVEHTLAAVGVGADVRVAECRAMGADVCVLLLEFAQTVLVAQPAEAA
jgi:hypothetical protein